MQCNRQKKIIPARKEIEESEKLVDAKHRLRRLAGNFLLFPIFLIMGERLSGGFYLFIYFSFFHINLAIRVHFLLDTF